MFDIKNARENHKIGMNNCEKYVRTNKQKES